MADHRARLKQLEKGRDPERFAAVVDRVNAWIAEVRAERLAYGPIKPVDNIDALLYGLDPREWLGGTR